MRIALNIAKLPELAEAAAACAAMNDWSDEKTDDPHYADRRNFYDVEKWSWAAGRICFMKAATPPTPLAAPSLPSDRACRTPP